MRRYTAGSAVALRYIARDLGGNPIATSVACVVTNPDGEEVPVDVTTDALGVYDATVSGADTAAAQGPWDFAWRASGVVEQVKEGQFYVAPLGAELPPLAAFEKLSAKIGYVPEDSERDRAEALLDEASELIRDVAGKTWTEANGELQEVPYRVRSICVAAAFRAFDNPEGLTQRSIGDSSKSYDRTGREGGEIVYLTDAEEKAIRKAAGGSTGGMVSVTLVSPYSGDPLLSGWEAVVAE